jgi:hypothetical protein
MLVGDSLEEGELSEVVVGLLDIAPPRRRGSGRWLPARGSRGWNLTWIDAVH